MMSVDYLYTFRRIMATICCIFGLPGNILTIIVCIKALCHRTINFERKVFDLYLAEISILDTCLLLYWVIETLIHYLYSLDKIDYFSIMHLSAFSCYFFYMLNRLFAALCSWLITCFTVIRFLNIFRRLNTIRSNLILVTCLTIIFSIANSYLIVTLGYDPKRKPQSDGNLSNNSSAYLFISTRCYIRDEYGDDPTILLLNTLVAGFLNLVLPSFLTLFVNITILCYLKRVYENQTCEPKERRSDSSGASYRSTRSTLLVISMTYTLCYLPYCIIYLLLIRFGDSSETLFYLSEIAFILRYISHSVNFYAYIFTNHRFRRDILSFLRHIICRPSSCVKKPNRQKQKQECKHFVFRPPGLTPSTPMNNSAAKMICSYQRPTSNRFQNQNYTGRQKNLQVYENYFDQQKSALATTKTSKSFDKFAIRDRL